MPALVHAYDAVVQIEPDIVHGDTPLGRRIRVPIVGGTFEGDRLRGTVVPGGADWQLLRADGSLVIEADYFMRTDDDVEVHVRNVGLWCDPGPDEPRGYSITTPVFEVPMGRYSWLNRRIFTCRLWLAPDDPSTVRLAVYEVTMDAVGGSAPA
jgi:hypothetical protein